MDIKKQQDYQNFIVDNKFEQDTLNFDYIKAESKQLIEDQVKNIENFIKEHQDFDNYSEEEKDGYYKQLFDTEYESLRTIIKEKALYSFDITGDEFNQLKNFIQTDCLYDASSVFYGIHLDATFFKRYSKKVTGPENLKIEILSGESILLYELMCKKTITGIKSQAYMFASTLRKLAECAKIYQHYDKLTADTFKKMYEWNMGLSSEKLEEVKQAIVKTMATEELTKMNAE